jgi:putative MATE family efflux protein
MQDMTAGHIHGTLVRFAVPLVLGNVFQLAYNATDSVIVGRCIGKTALAAVGAANPVMNIAIFFVAGLCMGASVLMSEFFGAHDTEKLHREISTAMLAGCVFSLCLGAVGCALAEPLLRLIRTPAQALAEGAAYLRVIFLGMIFTFLYNFYANTLRALGDSRTPLYFLTISAVLNVLADLAFVVLLRWGVVGCAFATVLAQALSCLLCGAYIRLRVPELRLGRGWLVFERALLGRTVRYGWASALQQAALYIGKLLVQVCVNTMGVAAVAAFNAVNRMDDFAFTPQQNIGHAMTTFLAQNRGAGRPDRVRKGFRAGVEIAMVYTTLPALFCLLLAEPLMRLFTSDTAVVELGVKYLRLIALMYFLPALTNTVQGYFRGMGELRVTLWSTMVNMAARVAAVWLLMGQLGFLGAAWGNFAGWIAMLAFELPLFARYRRRADHVGSGT